MSTSPPPIGKPGPGSREGPRWSALWITIAVIVILIGGCLFLARDFSVGVVFLPINF